MPAGGVAPETAEGATASGSPGASDGVPASGVSPGLGGPGLGGRVAFARRGGRDGLGPGGLGRLGRRGRRGLAPLGRGVLLVRGAADDRREGLGLGLGGGLAGGPAVVPGAAGPVRGVGLGRRRGFGLGRGPGVRLRRGLGLGFVCGLGVRLRPRFVCGLGVRLGRGVRLGGLGRRVALGLGPRLGLGLAVRDGGGLGGGGGLGVLAERRPLADDLGDQLLGLAAGGAVADRHDRHPVLADEVLELDLRLGPAVLRRVGVDDPVLQQVAVGVEHGDLAAGPEAGVDGEHDLVGDRRLEQEAAEVPGEDVDRVPLGHLGQVAADLALHARQEQAVDRVGRGVAEDVGVGVAVERELREGGLFQVGPGDLQLDLQRPFLVTPVDRQDAVRGDVGDRLGVVEVVAVLQALPLGDLGLGGDDLAGLPDDPADGVADGGQLADGLGEDVADPFEHLPGVLDPLLGVDVLLGGGVQVGQGLVAVPDPQRQRLQPLVAGVGRLGLLLGLEGEVKVFEPLGVVGPPDRGGELLGELALGLDRLEDRFLALGQLAEPPDPDLDLVDGHLVQVPGPLLAVSGDERHRVALVEQLDDALHLHAPDLQVLRDPTQVDRNRGVHKRLAPDEGRRRRGRPGGPPRATGRAT